MWTSWWGSKKSLHFLKKEVFLPIGFLLRKCSKSLGKTLCLVNLTNWENALECFLPPRNHLWTVNSLDVLSYFVQKEYWNGFSQLWLCLCVLKWSDAFWYREHWKRFSKLFWHLCLVKSLDLVNTFWQHMHWNGFLELGALEWLSLFMRTRYSTRHRQWILTKGALECFFSIVT